MMGNLFINPAQSAKTNEIGHLLPNYADSGQSSPICVYIFSKKKTETKRAKAKTGSAFKNWLVEIYYEEIKIVVTAQCSHSLWERIEVGKWYDVRVEPAKIDVTQYRLVNAEENSRSIKSELLIGAGLIREIGNIIIDYSFPAKFVMTIKIELADSI